MFTFWEYDPRDLGAIANEYKKTKVGLKTAFPPHSSTGKIGLIRSRGENVSYLDYVF